MQRTLSCHVGLGGHQVIPWTSRGNHHAGYPWGLTEKGDSKFWGVGLLGDLMEEISYFEKVYHLMIYHMVDTWII